MQDKTLMVFPAGQDALLAKPLSKMDYRVLWWLVKNLPPGGAVVTQPDISAGCMVSAPAVARTMDKLTKDGFIRRISKSGASYHYRLNTSWFGFV